MIPFGKGSLRRDGTDMVVLTWGALVQRSLSRPSRRRKTASASRCSTCARSFRIDWEGIAALVRKTNKVIVAHEDTLTCGFGAEIAARIGEELFEYLDAPVKRVAAIDCPVAYCPDLEEVILPQSADVLAAIRKLAFDGQKAEGSKRNSGFSDSLLLPSLHFHRRQPSPRPRRSPQGRRSRSLPHVVGLFREPIGFKQTANGDYTCSIGAGTPCAVDRRGRNSREAGADRRRRGGRLIEPSAFDVAVNGSFAVADAPNPRARADLDAGGVRTGGFLLRGAAPRASCWASRLNGVGTLAFNGHVADQPTRNGWLMTEMRLGQRRSDRSANCARPATNPTGTSISRWNSGIPIADPKGGFYFVFMAASRCSP